LADQIWVDLINPTEAERSAFERASGLSVPSKDDVAEIEATSRLKIENDALYMTAPLIFSAENEPWLPTPVGFVLSKQLLMTVRFATSAAFDVVAKETSAAEKPDPPALFVRLLEEQIDHLADLLELVSRDLDDASHTIFRPDHEKFVATKRAAAPVDDQYRAHQRTHGANTLHIGLSRPHGEVHGRPRAGLAQV
jgi:magnesium transporter